MQGPNRSDLSAIPGTPGTPLPPSPGEPQVQYGDGQRVRRRLEGIPLAGLQPGAAGGLLADSTRPGEPVTSGIDGGPGVGPEGLIPGPGQINDAMAAKAMQYAYPVLYRLATLPNSNPQTRILIQRLRAQLPVQPEQFPILNGPS